MSWTSPRTWNVGELVTKLIMDTHIRDNLNALWVGTTAGDMEYYTSATDKTRIPKGSAKQILTMNSSATAPEWGSLIGNRQGGSSTDWNSGGTTNYTPSNPKIQVGVTPSITLSFLSGTLYGGGTTITFPVAFTNKPIVFATMTSSGSAGANATSIQITSITNTQMYLSMFGTGSGLILTASWMAIGE